MFVRDLLPGKEPTAQCNVCGEGVACARAVSSINRVRGSEKEVKSTGELSLRMTNDERRTEERRMERGPLTMLTTTTEMISRGWRAAAARRWEHH